MKWHSDGKEVWRECGSLEWNALTYKPRPPAAFHVPSSFCEGQIGARNQELVVSPEKALRQ